MRIAWLTIVALFGCEKRDPLFCGEHPDQCPDGGVPSDGAVALLDARLDFGSGEFALLLTEPPAGPITLPTTLNTTNATQCIVPRIWVSPVQPAACFIVATTITVNITTVTGTRPLVLVATDTIVITNKLDVAGHVQNAVHGPGAPSPGCGAGTEPATGTNGGGGGAGGSFMTTAGNGGSGNGATPAAGGLAATMDAAPPTLLRAGCDGQRGALGSGGNQPNAGPGGGAVYLVAGTKIDLSTGIINASGGGGATANNRDGGSGGGGGGMIVLSAAQIPGSIQTKLVANGGSGASGGNGGQAGRDPDPTMPSVGALGGTGTCTTATGGSGYPNINGGGNGASSCGGGGGGGAAGIILWSTPVMNGEYSPPPAML